MIKNKGFEIWLIIILGVFSLILFGVYLAVNLFGSKNEYLLFLKPYTILECKKWNCENVSDKLSNYNNKDYKVYFDGEEKGLYNVFYNNKNDKFYVFDKLNNNIYKNERFLIYSGKANIVQRKLEYLDIEEDEYRDLMGIISEPFKMEDVTKSNYDFDGDGKTESIFVINGSGDKLFNALIYKDKNLKLLNKKEGDVYQVGFSYISNLLDIFDDNDIEFVYTTAFYDEIGTCNVLYRLEGKEFVKVNDCEIVKG